MVMVGWVELKSRRGPSVPVKHAERKRRAPRPDAPNDGAKERAGLLRSG
jgi:hypothetical protein